MVDHYELYKQGLESPARSGFAITPHDTNELAVITRGVYVGVGGSVVAILASDSSAVTFLNVVAGTVLPIRAKVITTASTATNMIGLY